MTNEDFIQLLRENITLKLAGRDLHPIDISNISSDFIAQVLLLGIYDRIREMAVDQGSIYNAVGEIRDSIHGIPGKW